MAEQNATPPDVAALLARVEDVHHFVNKATKWSVGAEELSRELDVRHTITALADALRAALADTKLLNWLDTQRAEVLSWDGNEHIANAWSVQGANTNVRAAIIGAMSAQTEKPADGGPFG